MSSCAGELARPAAAADEPLVDALEPVALALGQREIGAQRGERVLEVRLADLLQRQHFGELRELRVEPRSAVSLPVTSCDRKNCTITNTESRNTMPRISVDSASTKPGQ